MATRAKIEKEKQRTKLVAQYKARRTALYKERAECYAMLENPKADHNAAYDRIAEIQDTLDKMPRNSSPARQRRRCQITGRPRGVYRKFKLCRNKIRELAMMGMFPGVEKSSW